MAGRRACARRLVLGAVACGLASCLSSISDRVAEVQAKLIGVKARDLNGCVGVPFSVDEDGEVSSSEDERDEQQDLTRDEAKLLREVEAKRRKMERESIIAASALRIQDKNGDEEGGEVKIDVPKPPEGQEAGGWQDAAWLLSVASKALF